jgi:hypothetical protein
VHRPETLEEVIRGDVDQSRTDVCGDPSDVVRDLDVLLERACGIFLATVDVGQCRGVENDIRARGLDDRPRGGVVQQVDLRGMDFGDADTMPTPAAVYAVVPQELESGREPQESADTRNEDIQMSETSGHEVVQMDQTNHTLRFPIQDRQHEEWLLAILHLLERRDRFFV